MIVAPRRKSVAGRPRALSCSSAVVGAGEEHEVEEDPKAALGDPVPQAELEAAAGPLRARQASAAAFLSDLQLRWAAEAAGRGALGRGRAASACSEDGLGELRLPESALGRRSRRRSSFLVGPPPPPAPGGPGARPFYAASVLIDVSGSVAAAQRLIALAAAESPMNAERRGADALSGALNRTFARVLRVVRAHGGDVVRFLGDALLVLVYGEDGPFGGAEAACRAAVRIAAESVCTCARREAHDEVEYEGEAGEEPAEDALPLHAAVAAGRMFAIRLGGGGAGRRRAAGPGGDRGGRRRRAVRLRARALEVTPEGYEVYGAREGEDGGEGEGEGGARRRRRRPRSRPRPRAGPRGPKEEEPRPSRASFALRGSAAAALRRRLSGGQGGREAGAQASRAYYAAMAAHLPEDIRWTLDHDAMPVSEMRVVTAAFVSLGGVELPGEAAGVGEAEADEFPPERLSWLEACAGTVLAAARSTEGVLRSLFCDDKGLACFLTWGVVGALHSDDPLRACTAALRIRDGFREQGLGPVSVGIATGRLFCGIVGDEARREYSVLGHAANMAARLAAAAGGAVWCDAATREAAGPRLLLDPLPPCG
eukprot:tig00020921_g15918.t1